MLLVDLIVKLIMRGGSSQLAGCRRMCVPNPSLGRTLRASTPRRSQTVPVLDWLVAGGTAMDEAIDFHDGMINPADADRMGFFERSDEVMGSVSPC